MVQLNRVLLAGNLVRDPELRRIGSGGVVCEFSIAVTRRWKSGEQTKEETSFFDVECWGKTAEASSESLRKGRAAVVEGRLKQERWEGQGGTRSRVVIVAESVQAADARTNGHPSPAPALPKASDIDFDS